ncbi:amidase [Curvibacter sp. RS43]|uniref:amidase n=1 Tax=Curvibacter microcysteis TaxID=3026419 RepID=UPI002361501B|nr:amidase [Curvibacter sp. RS43]MDD0808743.1 amidase [Curvibacter sp. RS43]
MSSSPVERAASAPSPASSPLNDLVQLDAVALSRAIHQREVSCLEVLDAFQAQIAHHNPRVNALVALADPEPLRDLARERDAQLARGQSLGVLHGFPQAPKDIAPVEGLITTRGSPLFKGQRTRLDAQVFERMRAAGALFIGRSNSPEFGLGGHTYNPVYGITRNAFDPSRSAGGSSGGAGVAVALNMLPLADGSDMMGSLRTPAAFNHVFGFRPSVGCVPQGPADEVFFQQFGVSGPMARNVPDLGLLLSVQAGFDARQPLTRQQDPRVYAGPLGRDFQGTRIGWLGDLGGHLATEPGVLPLCEQALRHFDSLGCTVEAVRPNADLERVWTAWLDLRAFQMAGNYAVLYNDPARRAQLKPEAVWEIERGLALSGQDVFRAASVRSHWYQALRSLFEQVDYLVLPTAQVFPFEAEQHWPAEVGGRAMDTYHRWMEVVIAATLAGLPALSVPAGLGGPEGRWPVGLQLIGPTQADLAVLQLGHAYDQAGGFSKVRSPWV